MKRYLFLAFIATIQIKVLAQDTLRSEGFRIDGPGSFSLEERDVHFKLKFDYRGDTFQLVVQKDHEIIKFIDPVFISRVELSSLRDTLSMSFKPGFIKKIPRRVRKELIKSLH